MPNESAERGRALVLRKVRAALDLARMNDGGDGVTWSPAEWERVLRALTTLQARVLYKVLLLGLSHAEAAEVLGITRSSVTMAWHRACLRIRDVVPMCG